MKLTITSADKKQAKLYGDDLFPNRYNANKHVIRKKEGICLFITGVLENGVNVCFYSPTTVITKTEGVINWQAIVGGGAGSDRTANNWFECVKIESKAISNVLHYAGSTEASVYLVDSYVINHLVKAGDVIDITFKVKNIVNNVSNLYFVKIIK